MSSLVTLCSVSHSKRNLHTANYGDFVVGYLAPNIPFGNYFFPLLDLQNGIVYPKAFVDQQPVHSLNPDSKPIS